jgi:ketosteroid isomerase-like protein
MHGLPLHPPPRLWRLVSLLLLGGCALPHPGTPAPQAHLAARRAQLAQAERDFAHTLALRDAAAFAGYVSEDAVFLSGAQALRGRTAVLAGWQRFFEGAQAPFSWEPDQAEVDLQGTLGHTSGPVRDAQGRLIARFYSTWRLEADGRWRVVLDNGVDVGPDGQACAR